ncbi:MAG: hypothetical protein ACLT8E_07690 [Akkermansia sp.]
MKIGQLRGAENLDTFVGKVGVEAGDRQPGAVEGGFADMAAEAGGAVDEFQLKGFLVLPGRTGAKSTFFTLDLLNIILYKETKHTEAIKCVPGPCAGPFFEKGLRHGMPHYRLI